MNHYYYHSSKIIFLLLCCLFSTELSTQNLELGSMAFTGYNADADPNNPSLGDEFSFVLLASVDQGQVLSFTDRGWLASGGLRAGEGTLSLTFDASYSCATEFRIYEENGSWKAANISGAGTPTLSESGDFSLSSSGDQILVYQGAAEPTAGNESAFVTALQFAGAWQVEATGTVESTQPSVFANTAGTDFVIDPHFDNGKYDCLINAGEPAALRANIYNLSNWGFDNSSANRFDLSTPCTFFCQGICTAAVINGISTNSLNNTFCQGDVITFSIDGNLNDASLWSLNNGSCDGEQLTTSAINTIQWTATKSGTFYIGGLGGCVTNPNCTAIDITVNGTIANAGPDQRLAIGVTSTILQGNSTAGGTGTWSFVDEGDGNGMIAEPNNPSSAFSGTSGQHYELAWTIVTPGCPGESTDEVLISFLNPTPLQLGDIAFTAYSADEDDFAFAILRDIKVGTQISFTEKGWFAFGGFRPGESSFTFEFNSAYECGSEFIVYDLPQLVVKDASDEVAGTIVSGDFLALSTSGDQIFAYQGSEPTAGNESGFLAAIQMNGAWDADATNNNESALPSVFTNGENAIAIIPEAQNAKYDCSTTSAPEGQLASILNNASLWDASDSPFVLNPSTLCQLDCQNCSLPIIESVEVPTIDPCPGDAIILHINGALNGAAEWVVFADNCNGEVLATNTGNMIEVIPPLSGSLFVAARGGCVVNILCSAVGINIGGILANAGPDQKVENGNTTSLAASGAYASGNWSFAAGGLGDSLGIISDTADPTADFQGTPGQSYVLRWTLAESNDCGSSEDEVEIAFLGASTELALGDIVFITYSADNDDFSFVILKDIQAGTTINFTDRGWQPNGGFRPGEGDIQITFCRPYNCGSQFNVFDATQEVKDAEGKIAGTISGTALDLSTSGDQIFAYQGPEPTSIDESPFVAAIQMNGDWDTGEIGTVESNKPSVFTDGINAISIAPQVDNAFYACTAPGPAEPAETRALVNQAANWTLDDFNAPTLPLDCVLRCCDEYKINMVTANEAGPYCIGDLITVSVEGELNGAAEWVWYVETCGAGQAVGTGASIEYKVGGSTSLYVRGEGGCNDIAESCFALNIAIEDTPPTAICQDISINLGDNYTASDLDGGSSDNCPDFTLSIDLAALGCTSLGNNTILLTIEDTAGQRDSCEAIVNVMGEDEDCDGVADECDQCPSGDDKVDNNGNDIPDCTEVLSIDQIVESWRCGPQLDSVFVCSIMGVDTITAQTLCVGPSAIEDILQSGGYLGPCGNTPCGSITSTSIPPAYLPLQVFPNPATDQIMIQLPSIPVKRVHLSLYNSFGQLVRIQQVESAAEQRVTWGIRDMPAGLYLLTLENQHAILAKTRLVILP